MKEAIKITKFILNFITSLIIIVGVIFILLFAIGIQPFVVESGSMEPAIKTGSVCFINKRANYDNMQVGDIIAFKIDDNAFATHRIYEITENGFVTKGDANAGIDNVITTRDNFIGKNVFSIPNAGFIIKTMQTARGRIIIGTVVIILLTAGILLGEPSKKKSKLEKNKDKNN